MDEKDDGKIRAPFTAEQVDGLNRWQHTDYVHPFTCGNSECRAVLVATEGGWVCHECHSYSQDWAHDFMVKEPVKPWPFTGVFGDQS